MMTVRQLHLTTNARAGRRSSLAPFVVKLQCLKNMSANLSNVAVKWSALLLLIIVVIILNFGAEANYPDTATIMVFLRNMFGQLAYLNIEDDR